ncbi:hypothetical protein [Candidatus Binatus sp.]|uniref:hypothetical protein n=1 Tax=Candidatus Binatus sp. TaxID=2811406 RepID=UPI003C78C2A8
MVFEARPVVPEEAHARQLIELGKRARAEASNANVVWHPDEASNASGRKDLGQLRVVPVILTTGALATEGTDLGQLRLSEAGSGFRNRAALLKYITGQSKDWVETAGEDNAAHELNAAMQDGVSKVFSDSAFIDSLKKS